MAPGSAPIDQFRDQLEATVEVIWAIHRATGHYSVADEAFRELRKSTKRAKTALRAMEESSTAPEMAKFCGLLKLDEVSSALVAVNKLERTLSRLPPAFSGRQKPRKGPALRRLVLRLCSRSCRDREGNSALTRRLAAIGRTTHTRRSSPDLRSPSRSYCLTGRDRKLCRPVRSGSIERQPPPKTRLMRRSRARGGSENRPAAG